MAKLVLDEPKDNLVLDEPEQPVTAEEFIFDMGWPLGTLKGEDAVRMQEALKLMPNPQEYLDRMATSAAISQASGMSLDTISANIKNISKEIYGEDLSPSQLRKRMQDELRPINSRKRLAEAVKHGYSRAGMMMVGQLAGAARMETELGGRFRDWAWAKIGVERPVWQEGLEDRIEEWGQILQAGVDTYYRDYPEEAIRVPQELGYFATLKEYVTKPENLVQGVVESVPMVLEAIIGTVTGGGGGAVVAIALPITAGEYEQARKEGTTPLPALGRAIATGTGEGAIEQWTMSRKFGLLKGFREIVKKGGGRVIWEGVKAFFRGTAEEGSQEFNRNFWRWVFTDRSQDLLENVKQSAAAGGPLEMVMAGGFATTGLVADMVTQPQQRDRLNIIRTVVDESKLSAVHKAEIRAELDIAEKEVEAGFYKEEEKAEAPKAVAPTEIEALAKELEENMKLTPERALEVAAKKLAYDEQKAAEAVEKAPEPAVQPSKAKITPVAEEELTKTEESAIAKLEAEIEEPFEMVRVKDVGFVIKEKATQKEAAVIPKRKAAKAALAEFNEGARKIRETKRKAKVLTDTTRIDKLITEARALKVSLKKAAQAARKAFREGRREGIEKIKTHYMELKAREQERKALKGRVNKAIKTIKAKIPASVDFFYREAIEVLQAGIDPSLRTTKTLRQRERTKEFLARESEALKDMPVKLIKVLQKKSIGELTVADIEQIAQEIETLKTQGKLKRKLKFQKRQRELEEVRGEIEENVTKGEPVKTEKEPVVYSTTKQGLISTAWEKTKAWTWRPSRIFDMLDGMKNFAGKAHRFFIDQVNRATDAKLRRVDARKDAGTAKMESLGITMRDLTFIRTIDGIKYSVDEMIGIYNANKNRLAKLAIMYGNNLTEGNIKNIITGLTEAEKVWGDYIVQDYDNNYERLRQEVIRVENRDMGYEENYTPMRRTEIDYTTHTEEVIDEILQKEALRKAYAEHGMTIKRKEVPAEFQKPIRLNATSTWLSQIAKQEHYIHFAQLVKDMHKLAEGIREPVEQKFGKEFNKVIRNYIDRVANPNVYKSYNSLENVSRKLRKNAVIAYLAYNLVTMAKQIPSVFLYLQDAGPTHLISSAMDFIAHPIDMIKMVREKDPQVKHRAIERELEEMKTSQPERYWAMVNKFGKAGMEGIYLFDAVARTIGWNAVYQKALKSDKSEAESVRLAQNATLRTQPAAAAKDLAQLYATNEFANWFTMFTNQLNQIYNMATYDFTGYVKNAEYQKAALSLMGLSITALTIWIITHRRLPENAEDLADAMGEQAINAIPLVGKALMAGKKGWGTTEIPAFELPKAVGRSIGTVAKGEFDDKDMKAIAEGVAVAAGIPYIGPKRVIKVAETGELKEIVGGEPIEKKSGKRILVSGK